MGNKTGIGRDKHDRGQVDDSALGLPHGSRPGLQALNVWAKKLLDHWSSNVSIDPRDHVSTLNPELRFIVEFVKALACNPKVLVLDEPTEHLATEDVERLFDRARKVTERGAAVIYISQRIREVQAIANRLTVLREDDWQGTYDAAALSEDQIVALIVGSDLDRTVPDKAATGNRQKGLAIQD